MVWCNTNIQNIKHTYIYILPVDTLPLSAILLRWIKAQLHAYEFTQHLNEVSDVFTSGKVLVALINR